MNEQPTMVKIEEVIEEADGVKSFMFHHKIDFVPGQFIMVWIPQVDEKPFTISYHDSNTFGITVFKLGEFTTGLYSMVVGNIIGIRGPYGKGFTISGKTCAIGGGVGMASIATLASKIDDLIIVQGAKTDSALLYQDRFPGMIICTDDGTKGLKGYPTDHILELLRKHKFETIYTCGPEIMMRKIFDFCQANRINCEASLERFMKCGIGICGQCVCDGFRVCTDGPVFDTAKLAEMNDFGRFTMLKSGKRVGINEL
ncbi:MAG: dihydroorotate dehydrogenase electron transfer subunit [Candidatus Anammoxibacter sp.]